MYFVCFRSEKKMHKICNTLFIEFNEVCKKPLGLKSFVEKLRNRRNCSNVSVNNSTSFVPAFRRQ